MIHFSSRIKNDRESLRGETKRTRRFFLRTFEQRRGFSTLPKSTFFTRNRSVSIDGRLGMRFSVVDQMNSP